MTCYTVLERIKKEPTSKRSTSCLITLVVSVPVTTNYLSADLPLSTSPATKQRTCYHALDILTQLCCSQASQIHSCKYSWSLSRSVLLGPKAHFLPAIQLPAALSTHCRYFMFPPLHCLCWDACVSHAIMAIATSASPAYKSAFPCLPDKNLCLINSNIVSSVKLFAESLVLIVPLGGNRHP